MKKSLVNALLLVMAFALMSCGFKLQRGAARLPEQAKSLALANIINQTYMAGLEWEVGARIKQRFAASQIQMEPSSTADLLLQITLNQAVVQDDNQENVTTNQYYFNFSTAAEVTLVDLRNGNLLWKKERVVGTYRHEALASILSEEEKRQGFEMAANQLAWKLQAKLTTYF